MVSLLETVVMLACPSLCKMRRHKKFNVLTKTFCMILGILVRKS